MNQLERWDWNAKEAITRTWSGKWHHKYTPQKFAHFPTALRPLCLPTKSYTKTKTLKLQLKFQLRVHIKMTVMWANKFLISVVAPWTQIFLLLICFVYTGFAINVFKSGWQMYGSHRLCNRTVKIFYKDLPNNSRHLKVSWNDFLKSDNRNKSMSNLSPPFGIYLIVCQNGNIPKQPKKCSSNKMWWQSVASCNVVPLLFL